MFLGHFYTAASGRSFSPSSGGWSANSQVFPEAIEELVPDSDTVALVLKAMATAAERWHDELWIHIISILRLNINQRIAYIAYC